MAYRVLSPDGFDIECGGTYGSRKQAFNALDSFLARYEVQGYYSTGRLERIPLDELMDRCTLLEV